MVRVSDYRSEFEQTSQCFISRQGSDPDPSDWGERAVERVMKIPETHRGQIYSD
jgi:hypothetical protein